MGPYTKYYTYLRQVRMSPYILIPLGAWAHITNIIHTPARYRWAHICPHQCPYIHILLVVCSDQHGLPAGFFGLPVPVPAKTRTHSTGMGFSQVYPWFLQGFAGMYGSAGI